MNYTVFVLEHSLYIKNECNPATQKFISQQAESRAILLQKAERGKTESLTALEKIAHHTGVVRYFKSVSPESLLN